LVVMVKNLFFKIPAVSGVVTGEKRKEVAMGKLKINGCVRCKNGEVFIDRDLYGWYECCLQCGYSRDLPDLVQTVDNEWKKKEEEGSLVKKGRSPLYLKENEMRGK
jgi:hypothetical protein